jgi:hypothetical protein
MADWRELVLDPTGGAEREADTALAPRPGSLRGTTLGLLDNGKPNGAVLLAEIGRQLDQRFDLRDVRTFTKSYFGTPVERTQVEEIVSTCNFAVTAIGD